MSSKCIDFLYVIKSTIVNDCFVICVGLSLLSKTVDMTEQKLESVTLFLDLLKAFDTLDHEVLLSKLECYGTRCICNDWFCSYLTERLLIAKVQISENKITKSESFNISYGTAQGSCLDPLLIILFMNDMHLLPTFSSV